MFGQLSQRHGDVSVNELLKAVIDSPAGREFLRTKGLPDAEIDEVVAALVAVDDEDWATSPKRREAIEALAPFGRMLTVGEPPKKGVMRMDRYVKALQKNLLKMRRPSVIVIGQPGTGKTALVYEFARMIIEKDPAIVPSLRDRDVFELSPSFLRAGASMVGQYEERISSLLKVLEANPKIILFVDEVHSLLSSGMHERGPFSDANESFKTAVGRGGISLIGATTLAEYRHYIAPDGALARRFGLIKIDPPDVDETVAILQGRVSQYRRHYAPLEIPDEILAKDGRDDRGPAPRAIPAGQVARPPRRGLCPGHDDDATAGGGHRRGAPPVRRGRPRPQRREARHAPGEGGPRRSSRR